MKTGRKAEQRYQTGRITYTVCGNVALSGEAAAEMEHAHHGLTLVHGGAEVRPTAEIIDGAELISRRSAVSCQEIDRELTGRGRLFCLLLGLLEEILVFFCFGIQISSVPIAVTLFLWISLAMVSGGVLLGADAFCEVCGEMMQKETSHFCHRQVY